MSETQSKGILAELGRERAVILGGLMLGMLLGSIDQSIVSTALPTIVGDLGGSGSLSWVVTAYLITVSVTTPLYGKLSDLYGRSIVYEFSIAVFLIGSALSGLSGDIPVLDAHLSGMAQLAIFRAVQGVGAGGLIAMATTILGDIFSPRERGQYMSYMMLIFGASTVGGPLLGGWLTDNYTWRWIFYINIPIGLAAIAVIHAKLDLPVPEETHDIDYLGAGLLTVAVAALMLVTSWGGSKYDWQSTQIYGLAAVAVVGAVLFVAQELRASEPIFPVHLLTRRTIAGVDILSFTVGIGMLGGTTFLPVYLQTVLGQSATNSGLLLLPLVGGLMITSALTGQLMTRLGHYKPFTVVGAAVAGSGYYLLSTMSPSTTHLESSAFMFVAGLGLGFVMPTLTVAVQNAVDRKHLGVATTSVTFSRSLGSAIGVSVFGAVLTNQLTDRLTDAVTAGDLSPQAAGVLAQSGSNLSPQVFARLPPAAVPVVKTALANSIDVLFLTGAAILAFAFLVALALPSVDLGEEANVQMGEMGPGPDDDVDAPGTEDGQKPSGAALAESATTTDGGSDASDDAEATLSATRSVTPPVLQPKQTARVTLDVPSTAGRVLLRETAPGDTPTVVDATPDAVRTVTTAGTLYAVWDLGEETPVSLTYETTVPDAVGEGDSLHFDGQLTSGRGEAPTDGQTDVAVVDDLFERLVVQDDVTAQDVTLAADFLERGELTQAQFELVTEKWLGRDAVETHTTDSPTTGND